MPEGLNPCKKSSALKFCGVCSHTFTYRVHLPTESYLHDIEASASRGCEQCTVVQKAVNHLCLDYFSHSYTASGIKVHFKGGPNILLVLPETCDQVERSHEHVRFGTSYKGRSLHFYCRVAVWDRILPRLVHGHVDAIRSLDATIKLTREWLSKCKTMHQHCAAIAPTTLPRRTVFIGSTNGDIRLSENKGTNSNNYTCLSHCWGAYQPLQATSSTIHAHVKGIVWSNLPKTFQDAIEITRALGISHIWIDSLCILQDDDYDWAVESSKMASIYSGSFLTIAATAAEDARGGCLRYQNECQPFEISLKGNNRSMFVMDDLHCDPQPLMRRAWAFQERRLSKRSLFFNQRELAWECESETICECKQYGPLNDRIQDAIMNKTRKEWWHDLIATYSDLCLTLPKDRLPALSGVAHAYRYGKEPREDLGNYLAGMWQGNIVSQLSWAAVKPSKDLDQYRAPSWSWASVDAPIQYRDYLESLQWCATLSSAKCEPSTGDRYGQVSAGYIDLTANIFEAQLCFDPANGGCVVLREQVDERGCILKRRIFDEVSLDFERKWQNVRSSPASIPTYCALIHDDSDPFSPYAEYTALLLEKKGPGDERFVRIGIGNLFDLGKSARKSAYFYEGSISIARII